MTAVPGIGGGVIQSAVERTAPRGNGRLMRKQMGVIPDENTVRNMCPKFLVVATISSGLLNANTKERVVVPMQTEIVLPVGSIAGCVPLMRRRKLEWKFYS